MPEVMKELLMSLMNWPALLVATLIPMIIGFVWYNPKTPTGAIWLKETGLSDEQLQGGNMPLIFALSLLFSFLMNFFIVSHEVVHQWGAFSLLNEHPEEAQRILTTYADTFRTFGHGVAHGLFLGLFFVLPIIAINGMFERKSWKLIFVHVGYWTVSLMLMGGLICAWY